MSWICMILLLMFGSIKKSVGDNLLSRNFENEKPIKRNNILKLSSKRRLQNGESTLMLALLDSLQREMTGDPNSKYSRSQFSRLRKVFMKLGNGDDVLIRSQEKGWTGLVDYYSLGGAWNDAYGNHPNNYKEYNATVLRLRPTNRTLVIFEPCNVASNLVYYHLTVAIYNYFPNWSMSARTVRALGQSTASLTIGSSFFHASHTKLGSEADTTNIKIMSYILHQALITALPPHLITNELLHLNNVSRQLTGVELSQVVRDMYLKQPVGDWLVTLKSLDVPTRRLSLSACVCTMLTPILPPSLVDLFVDNFADQFTVSEVEMKFIKMSYLPHLRKAVVGLNLNLDFWEKKDLLVNILIALKKIGVSFLFIEHVEGVPDKPLPRSPETYSLGALFIPTFNEVLDSLSSTSNPSPSLTDMKELYPGDTWCRTDQPHSQWHGQSAAGLLQLFLATDQLVKILKQ